MYFCNYMRSDPLANTVMGDTVTMRVVTNTKHLNKFKLEILKCLSPSACFVSFTLKSNHIRLRPKEGKMG